MATLGEIKLLVETLDSMFIIILSGARVSTKNVKTMFLATLIFNLAYNF